MKRASDKQLRVACPGCGAEVVWEARNKYRPFCSERCRLMDLGQWAAERYRVAGEPVEQEPADVAAGKDE
ncbi:DNA gyrase inhibitor YacG [Betaproteobacteria bacterium SCN2]|jgi:hypothetical protein|nr:DNA gyrase inhibitor YacG [Betaproteobacteria bacterium SCN2]